DRHGRAEFRSPRIRRRLLGGLPVAPEGPDRESRLGNGILSDVQPSPQIHPHESGANTTMKYNRPQATAAWGAMAKDWEQGIDYHRLPKERLARAQQAMKHAGIGAVLCFNFDNIRYLTATHIGEWARDKFMRYALCPVEGPPFLWDPAPPAKRISSPWI